MMLTHDDVVKIVANWFKSRSDIVLVGKSYGRTFPKPDVYAMDKNRKIYSVECKPSDANVREYITGLGQSVAYLIHSDYSYLALPEPEMNRYKRYFLSEDIGLISVVEDGVHVIREAKPSKFKKLEEEPRTRGYGYYRDLTPFEIYEILKVIHSKKLENLNLQEIKDAIWKKITDNRNIKSQKQKDSWILNIKLLLRDLHLINPDDYSLTEEGFRLLRLGESKSFMDELTKCFLLNANYIDIIVLIQEIVDEYGSFSTKSEFKDLLVQRIYDEKLATKDTNVGRDIQDILRLLRRDLKLIKENKVGSKWTYTISWRYIISLIKNTL